MLKTNIKASQISNLTDARYFAAWGVEWLGFCFDFGQDGYIAPQEVKAIKEWVVGPKIVGEFGAGQSLEEIQKYINLLQLDMIQVGPFADLELIKQLDIPVIKSFLIESLEDLNDLPLLFAEFSPFLDFAILDFNKNNISWESIKTNPTALAMVKEIALKNLVMLHIPLANAEEMDEIRVESNTYGFCLQGGEEEKVGYKSFDELDDIFETLEP